MYVKVEYLGTEVGGANRNFRLTDTEFTMIFPCPVYHHAMCIEGMTKIYERRGMPVAPNIARYYLQVFDQYGRKSINYLPTIMRHDKTALEINAPGLLLYFHCITRQIRQLTFGKYRTPII
jgi:hypothetical protein